MKTHPYIRQMLLTFCGLLALSLAVMGVPAGCTPPAPPQPPTTTVTPAPKVDPQPTPASQLKFEVSKDASKEWRWSLKHTNGNVMADSGEGYKNKGDCLTAIERLRSDVQHAPLVLPDDQ